jgi:hypothetical protein
MRIYADQGFDRFVLCLRHRGELIERFVRDAVLPSDLTIESTAPLRRRASPHQWWTSFQPAEVAEFQPP